MNSYSKGMVIDYNNQILIACSSLYHGFCERRSVTNLTKVERYILKPMVPNDQSSSSYVFIAPGPRPHSPLSLFIAATLNNYGQQAYRNLVPAISARQLDTFEYSYRDEKGGSLKKFNDTLKYEFLVSYVYGFSYRDYNYIISVQRENLMSSRLVTKIIRICEKDKYFNTYAELDLHCIDEDYHYNKAQAAILESGSTGTLYVAFIHSVSNSYDLSGSKRSAVCSFDMMYIERRFDRAIAACYRGKGKLGPAHVVREKKCPKLSSSPDYCGSTEISHNYPAIIASPPFVEDPVLKWTGSAVTALTLTTSNGRPVLFLGTAEGMLKKAVLAVDGNFTLSSDILIHFGSPVQREMVSSPDGKYIYAMTETTIALITASKCSVYSDCASCIGTGDPYCGWCVMSNSCSRKDECTLSEVSPAWLPAADRRCVSMTNVQPPAFSVEMLESTGDDNMISFKLEEVQLPRHHELNIRCAFMSIMMLRTTEAKMYGDSNVQCPVPALSEFPTIAATEDHRDIHLELRVGGRVIVERNVPLYDCRVHKGCVPCTNSEFSCQWCAATHSCMNATSATCPIASNQHRSTSGITQSERCPYLETPTTDLVVHSGKQKEVSVSLKNFQSYQSENLKCHFHYNSKMEVVKASYTSGRVYCDNLEFSYDDNEQPYIMAMFKVTWGSEDFPIDNPNFVYVRVYKCPLMVTNCGKCLSMDPEYECGWCEDVCTLRKQCQTSWLDRDATCPNPQILRFSPVTGPIGGRTNISITGINLGKTVSDIQGGVSVKGITCVVEQDNYEASSGFTCETNAPQLVDDTMSGTIKVVVSGSYEAESDSMFTFVDPVPSTVRPDIGPQAGGTLLTIVGEHMDSGSSVVVMIGTEVCPIVRTNTTVVECISPAHAAPGDVVLITDFGGAKKMVPQKFKYVENPTITMIEPKSTIVSGGTTLTIMGTSLDVVEKPEFIVKTPTGYISSFCKAKNQYMVHCTIPSLLEHNLNATNPLPEQVAYGFIMDGVSVLRNISQQAQFGPMFFYPDPIVEIFTEEDPVAKFEENRMLRIEGLFPTAEALKSELYIYVGNTPCQNTVVTRTTLDCEPPMSPGNVDNQGNALIQIRLGNFQSQVGYLNYYEVKSSEKPIALGIILGVVLPILAIVTLLAICVVRRHIKHSPSDTENYIPELLRDEEEEKKDDEIRLNHVGNEVSQEEMQTFVNGLIGGLGDEHLQQSASELLIPRSSLDMGDLVGKGYYGCVYKADLRKTDDAEPVTVAVKSLQGNTNGTKNLQSFLKEAIAVKDFNHPHILSILGICLMPADNPMVVMPFVQKGDLRTYVKDTTKSLTVLDLLEFAQQIVEGMTYLTSLRFVHRNLAARNCFVTDDKCVKISDYGLTKDLFTQDFINNDDKSSQLFVKWLAPESLEKFEFSAQSDVWSYGVVLWELMTRGVTPYPDVEACDVKSYLKEGNRMKKPKRCPEHVYQIMLRCWSHEPSNRPEFSSLSDDFKSITNPETDCINDSEKQPLHTSVECAGSTEYLDVIG